MQAFGFSKKKAPQPKVAVQQEDDTGPVVEYVTGVQGNAIEGTREEKKDKGKIIPAIKNTFEVGTGRRRKAPSFIPTKEEVLEDEKRFHVAETIASGGEVAQKGVLNYGLTKMGPTDSVEPEESKEDRGRESFLGKSLQEKELQAFKEDMEDLPEQASIEEYESMPIEDFGKAMLRGMGWEEGKAVGRMHRGMVEAVEFIPRPGRLGLGAQPAHKDAPQKKYIKPGETRERKADMVRDPKAMADSGLKNVKTLDEKLVKREESGPREGKIMFISSGRHAGVAGRILKISGDKVNIELTSSGQVVTVKSNELVEMSESRRAKVGSKRDRDDREKNSASQAKPWLLPNIRVRVVSKSFKGGQFYLSKGMIIDVLTPTECMLQLEGGGKTIEIGQAALETVIPKAGGRICVVTGAFRGRRGKLLEKNKAKSTASIQLNDDFEAHVLPLDDIAEYVGALDEED